MTLSPEPRDEARLPRLRPEELDDDQHALRDAIAGGPRAGGPFRLVGGDGALEGPFNAFLLQPAVGQAVQALGAAIRYRTGLSDRAREIAVLVVAAAEDSAFERYAHEAVGRRAGLTDAELAALRAGDHAVFGGVERLVAVTTHALVTRGDLDDGEYAAAAAGLGLPRLFELLSLVGYYAMLALQLRVFRVGLPAQ